MARRLGLVLTIGVFLLTSCRAAWGDPLTLQTPTPFSGPPGHSTRTPFLPEGTVLASPSPTVPPPTPTLTPVPYTLWISPAVPPELAAYLRTTGLPETSVPEQANARLEVTPAFAEGHSVWIYALVTPFPSLVDEVSLNDIQAAWQGNSGVGPFAWRPLWMSETTLAAFTALWGPPATPNAVRLAEPDRLLDLAWAERPSWAIIPFEELQPRWKVLRVDGQSPTDNAFRPDAYPLKVAFSLTPRLVELPPSNRDPQKLTVLIMTGVTALVRTTAWRMEQKGLTYPGQDVREIFRAADLLHISNEVPFAENCPYPYPIQMTLVFCSDPRYIALLEDIGTDIVELTGNHFQDYGSAATLLTIDMYEQRGWKYFGGGRNLADAQKAALVEHNGNRLAFIGCNVAGPDWSWATADRPGSAPCDYEYMRAEIGRLRAAGYLPIATFQHFEHYNFYPSWAQVRDFRSMAEAGAVIVSGSHSHFPQYMEFYQDAYIHYGLGNLFFDQMDYPAVGTRREFADRYTFYDGRLISVELLTFMLEDFARPRPMTPAERRQFLYDIFTAGKLLP